VVSVICLDIQNVYILPHNACVFYVHVYGISEDTATFDICYINLLVIVTEMENLYCAVRTGSFKKTDHSLYLNGSLERIRKQLFVINLRIYQVVFLEEPMRPRQTSVKVVNVTAEF
jgi:hypothetical protein